jgi:hypothetical protein
MFHIALENLQLASRLLYHTEIRGEDECWFFKGSLDDAGYGQIRDDGKIDGAHRVSFKVFKGDPDGHVMHACDIRCCINPKHLSLGTHLENMADCGAKGRQKVPRPGNGYTKLEIDDIAEIMRLHNSGMNKSMIGRQFGVSANTVNYHIKKHL